MTCNCDVIPLLAEEACPPFASLAQVQLLADSLINVCCRGTLTTPGLEPLSQPVNSVNEAFPGGIGGDTGCQCELAIIIDSVGNIYLSFDDGVVWYPFPEACVTNPNVGTTVVAGTLPVNFEALGFGGSYPSSCVCNALWQPVDDGTLWVSVDCGVTWVEISGGAGAVCAGTLDTAANLVILRDGGGLVENCHYEVTDPTNLPVGASVVLQAETTTRFASHGTAIIPAYGTFAVVYDIDANVVIEAHDLNNNHLIGAATINQFQFAGLQVTNSRFHNVGVLSIDALTVIENILVETDATLITTNATGTIQNSIFSGESYADFTDFTGTFSNSEVTNSTEVYMFGSSDVSDSIFENFSIVDFDAATSSDVINTHVSGSTFTSNGSSGVFDGMQITGNSTLDSTTCTGGCFRWDLHAEAFAFLTSVSENSLYIVASQSSTITWGSIAAAVTFLRRITINQQSTFTINTMTAGTLNYFTVLGESSVTLNNYSGTIDHTTVFNNSALVADNAFGVRKVEISNQANVNVRSALTTSSIERSTITQDATVNMLDVTVVKLTDTFVSNGTVTLDNGSNGTLDNSMIVGPAATVNMSSVPTWTITGTSIVGCTVTAGGTGANISITRCEFSSGAIITMGLCDDIIIADTVVDSQSILQLNGGDTVLTIDGCRVSGESKILANTNIVAGSRVSIVDCEITGASDINVNNAIAGTIQRCRVSANGTLNAQSALFSGIVQDCSVDGATLTVNGTVGTVSQCFVRAGHTLNSQPAGGITHQRIVAALATGSPTVVNPAVNTADLIVNA